MRFGEFKMMQSHKLPDLTGTISQNVSLFLEEFNNKPKIILIKHHFALWMYSIELYGNDELQITVKVKCVN